MRKIIDCKAVISYAAMGIGVVFTGLLLIPAGILAIMIYTVWTITDRIVGWCGGGEENGFPRGGTAPFWRENENSGSWQNDF